MEDSVEKAEIKKGAADKTIAEYEAATDKNFVKFVKSVHAGQVKSSESYSLGEVSSRAGQDLYDLIGVDVTGYKHRIDGNAVDHIEKRHGTNGVHDRSMADIGDYGRIGYVLEHYDDMDILRRKDGSGKHSKRFFDSNGNPAPMVRYKKRVNGTFYVVEAIPDAKSHTLHIVSAYKSKAKKGGGQTADVVQTPKLNVRNGSATTAKSKAKLR